VRVGGLLWLRAGGSTSFPLEGGTLLRFFPEEVGVGGSASLGGELEAFVFWLELGGFRDGLEAG